MKKIIPIVALIGMMSLGIQEMNVKAETYKSAGSKMDFWNSKRGTASISEKNHAKQATIKRANFTLSRVKLALLLIHVFYLEILSVLSPNISINSLYSYSYNIFYCKSSNSHKSKYGSGANT
ncbi:hypothetical protein COD94_23255 [Bacillus cereus]|nr:hypothetical protein COD94_23255 [Bacillus cereus]